MTLAGLHIIAADHCACGTRESITSDGRELRCVSCGEPRGRLGLRATSFIAAIIEQFGRPSEAITFRRAIGYVESLDLVIQPASSGQLVDEWLASRRQPFGPQ
jgi:hypothetical protein